MVATRSKQLPGVVFAITEVDNAKPGQKPSVTFSVNGQERQPAGHHQDGLPEPGADRSHHGLQRLRLRRRTQGTPSGGQFVYTFTAALPANAAGSYAVGIEGYKNFTINPGTVNSAVVRDVGFNKVFYFAVGGAKVTPRRQVVSQALCAGCHDKLMLHGGIRQSVEYCVVCHNPTVTDAGVRKTGDIPESINFKTLIHKIHTGAELTTDFTVIGHGGSVNNYNEVGYVGDRRDLRKMPSARHLRSSASRRPDQPDHAARLPDGTGPGHRRLPFVPHHEGRRRARPHHDLAHTGRSLRRLPRPEFGSRGD